MEHTASDTSVDSTYGCLFLAGIFSSVLWGGCCLQLYYYYEKYWKTEKLWLKLYTLVVWILDVVHQILLMKALYMYFVKEFGNFEFITRPQHLIFDEAPISAVINAMVQSIFVARVWHLSNKSKLLTAFLIILIAAQFTITLVYFGQIYNFTDFAQLFSVLNTERAMNAQVVVTDTCIATSLIVLLWRSRSGFRRTDSIINRLVMYTISTGLLTSLVGVVGLVGAQVQPASLIYLLADLIMPKTYVNSLLATLNARSGLRNRLTEDQGLQSIHLENLASIRNGSSINSNVGSRKISRSRGIECRVEIDGLEGTSSKPDFGASASGPEAV
ncbi:uncharacterized protein FOMMEDRAFT_148554 [Fomitiporia mediterranea MF3/22]|uniref:uncharacterized protein n=1 Tax=Fomitiporia mediterranea (strain MF3/22) TaxID=694068 RepID=UPI0004409C89|nr:uncharacterized protein FOMMEDRAFT_148554 [Fomitiporia mediterranea MF3/22]EJC99656.1 hypothetical protein FOMMEDRAFT_148554 [Fomitiporia mediterranea MF3/22]